MTQSMLIWKWSDDFDTKSKRRKLKFGDIKTAYSLAEDHPALGPADFSNFLDEVTKMFGADRDSWPFVLQVAAKAVLVSYASANRFSVVPAVGRLAMKCGLNGAELG